jgi:hypothetical protein
MENNKNNRSDRYSRNNLPHRNGNARKTRLEQEERREVKFM